MEGKSNKPNFIFAGLIFLFLYENILSEITVIYNACAWGLNTITSSPVPYSNIIYLAFFTVFTVYTYVSISGCLRLEKWSIPAIRMSIVLASVMLIQTPMNRISLLNFWWISMFLVLNLWFLTYTIVSKKLRNLIPMREKGIVGWMGIILFAIAILPVSITEGCYYAKQRNSEKITDYEKVSLSHGEITDGYAVYTLNNNWQIDTILVGDSKSIVRTPNGTIEIWSSPTEIINNKKFMKMDFHNGASECARSNKFGSSSCIITSLDTIASDNNLFISSYDCTTDSMPIRITYATLYSRNYYKKLSVLYYYDSILTELGYQDIYKFMTSVDFNMTDRLVEQ